MAAAAFSNKSDVKLGGGVLAFNPSVAFGAKPASGTAEAPEKAAGKKPTAAAALATFDFSAPIGAASPPLGFGPASPSNKGDEDVLVDACLGLSNVARGGEAQRAAVRDCGALPQLTALLRLETRDAVLEAALGALGYMLRGAVKSCADADDSAAAAAAAAAALGGAAAVESELPALVQQLLPLLDHASEGVSSDAAWCGGLATELLPAAQRVAVVSGALEAAAVGESHWWDCFAELLQDTRSAACREVLAPLCAKVATAAKQGAAVCEAAKECALLACEQCVGEREAEDGEKVAAVAMAIEGTTGGGIALIESLRTSDADADVADAGGAGTGAETTTETAATAARVLRGIDRALLATGVSRDELRAAHADAQFSVPEFECSISHDVMADPVVAEDGHTYERACIAAWLQRKGSSPLGGAAMGNRLAPNRALAKQIARFRAGARLEWLACDARLVPELRCPLTDVAPIMVDPAITPEGDTFERASIGKKEPMLPLVRNLALRSILRRFAEARALRTAAAAKAAATAAAEASAKAANAGLRDAHKERLARKQAAAAAAVAAAATAAAAAENGGSSATVSTNGALPQLLAVPSRPVLRRCISSPPASPSRDAPSTLRSHSLRADQLAGDRLVLCH